MKELLTELLMEEKTCFRIPFGDGYIDVYKSVVMTWGVMLVLFALILFLTHEIGRAHV